MTGIKIAVVLAFGIAVFIFADGSFAHFNLAGTGGLCEGVDASARASVGGFASGLAAAMLGALWAYDGWTNVAVLAGEVKDPQKNLPRALIGGMLIVIALYLLANLAYIYALEPQVLASVPKSSSVAVEVGMVMAALLFIQRVSRTTTVSRVTQEYIEAGQPHVLQGKAIPDYVAIFRIHGPFLFGSTDKLHDISLHAESLPPVVILRCRNMTAVDGTGLSAIEELAEDLRATGRTLVICGAPAQPAGAMRKAEFHERLGRANICTSVQDALDRAAEIISTPRT